MKLMFCQTVLYCFISVFHSNKWVAVPLSQEKETHVSAFPEYQADIRKVCGFGASVTEL